MWLNFWKVLPPPAFNKGGGSNYGCFFKALGEVQKYEEQKKKLEQEKGTEKGKIKVRKNEKKYVKFLFPVI